jgi:hypothetical protein
VFRGASLTAAVAAGLGLAACAGPQGQPAPNPGPAVAAPRPAPPEQSRSALVAPRPATPAQPKRREPADLVGLGGAEINRLFGQPAMLRRDPPAEVWQFPGGRCVLLVFLYPEAAGPKVAHAEMLPRGQGEPLAPADCLDSLLKGPAAVS